MFVFYSNNADKITFEVHEMLCKFKADIEFFKVTTEMKNVLDLQLASFWGNLIQQYPKAEFYLVIGDKVKKFLE